MEQHLIISDIAARTGIEAHVLRYWEKELNLDIPRNELGHRYYLESHVDMFLKIQELKQAGYQLKAIKNAIDTNEAAVAVNVPPIIAPKACEADNSSEKLDQFALILKGILSSVIEEREEETFEKLVEGVSCKVIKQMDYLFRMQEELENERFKRLDESIRDCQKKTEEKKRGKLFRILR